jgi:hypothetical protein
MRWALASVAEETGNTDAEEGEGGGFGDRWSRDLTGNSSVQIKNGSLFDPGKNGIISSLSFGCSVVLCVLTEPPVSRAMIPHTDDVR